MDEGPGWMPDPDDADQERFWNGSQWTDRVRPATTANSLHLPEHVPELQRALAAATADIDAVEARLSVLFDRSGDRAAPPSPPSREVADGLVTDGEVDADTDTDLDTDTDTDTDLDTGTGTGTGTDASDGHIGTDGTDGTDETDGADRNGRIDRASSDARRPGPSDGVEPIHLEFADPSELEEGDGDTFAELDAALAAEEPDEPEKVKRGLFRRHS